MKKLFYSFLLLLIGAVLFSSTTYARVSDDEFGDFSTTIGEEYDYETTQEDVQGAIGSFISKLDFFGTRLLNNALTYLFYYPPCFTTKELGEKSITYANPKFCYPKGANKNAEKIQISELNAQDLMDGKYKVRNRTFLILILLLIIVGLVVYVLKHKKKLQKGNNSENIGDDSIRKELKSGSLFMKKPIIIPLLVLLVFGNILSYALNCSIRKHFAEGLTGDGALYGIGVLYLLAFLAFLGLVFIFIKYLLLPFIAGKTENKGKNSLPLNISKPVWISIAILAVVGLVISIFGAGII